MDRKGGLVSRALTAALTAVAAVAVATSLALAGALALTLAEAPPAAAAPLPQAAEPTQLTARLGARAADGAYPLTGDLKSRGLPVGGVRLDISVADGETFAVTTNATGQFTTTVKPSPGSHTITVQWAGNTDYASSARTLALSVPHPPAELTALPDVDSVNPGGVVTVSGALTSNGQPISDALLSATTTWNSDPLSTSTQADGTYALILTAPEDTVANQTTFVITVAFAGEAYYAAVSRDCQITVVKPTADATPSAAASVSATPSAPAAPTTPTQEAVAPGPDLRVGSPLFIVAVIFGAVAALAAGTLLIMAVVSRQRRVLAADERRGFGSDFGLADSERTAPEAAGEWYGPADDGAGPWQ
ncbi:MAG: hypothetical protein LBH76_07375 [Propionibacteriaceae bacterium]|jgi:hypothetical protein|nr:hypothetical protein [Propionibacteriaceae bacterium]